MKHIYIFLFYFLFISTGYSQQWAAVGTSWTYNSFNGAVYPGFVAMSNSPRLLTVEKDTLINGINASKISGVYDCGSASIVFTYESNRKYYFYNWTTNSFKLFVDLNKNAGDTFYMHIPYDQNSTAVYEDSIPVRVDSTHVRNVNGFVLRSASLRTINSMVNPLTITYYGSFTEFIGGDMPYPIHGACDPPSSGLRCFSDAVLGNIVTSSQFADCDSTYNWIVMGTKEISESDLNAFTNDKNLVIQSANEGKFELFSVSGTLVITGEYKAGTTRLTCFDVAPGIYVFRSGRIAKRIVLE